MKHPNDIVQMDILGLACTGGLGSRGGQDFDRLLDLRDKKQKPIMIPVFVGAYTAEELPLTAFTKDPLDYARRLVNPQNLSADKFSKTLIIDGMDKEPFFKDNISFSAEVPANHVLYGGLGSSTQK